MREKINKLFLCLFGLDHKARQVHNIKNDIQMQSLKMHADIQKLDKKTDQLNEQVRRTTAYKIYLATGGKAL